MSDRQSPFGRRGLPGVYQDFGRLVFSVALTTLGNRADAEDVTQQVFVRAWRSKHTFDPDKGNLRTWLLTITRRVIADRVTALTRQRAADGAALRNGHVPPDGDPAKGTVDRVLVSGRLGELTEQQQLVVWLAYFQDLSHSQIAERTQLPLGTVKSHLRRALAVLRERWGDDAAP